MFFEAEVQHIEDVFSKYRRLKEKFNVTSSVDDQRDPNNSRSSVPTPPSETSKTDPVAVNPLVEGARAQRIQDARARIPSYNFNQERSQFNTPQLNVYTPSYAERVPTQEPPRRSQYVNEHGTRISQDIGYIQSKRGSALEYYFKDRKFIGAPEQSVDNLIRDFEICSVQQSLDQAQMSLFFVNALADPARQYFLTHCSSHMPFEQRVSIMRRHYSSDTRKLQIQSEMDSLDLPSFMSKHNIVDNSHGLSKLVDHINALAPQLPTGFGDDSHKTRYLLRAVMSLDWARHPISQIATSKYSFI